MANHSSILAWRIPWTEEPGGLQSVGSQRVGPDWVPEPTGMQMSRELPVAQWVKNPPVSAGDPGAYTQGGCSP